MRDYLILDTSNYPLIIGTYQDFFPTGEEFSKWQTDMDSFNADKENYVMVLDFSKVQNLPTEYRIMAAKWAAKNDLLFVKKNLKVVFVTPSLSTRVMMKAIVLMTRPKSTYMIVSSLEKAHAWAKGQLAMTVPTPSGL